MNIYEGIDHGNQYDDIYDFMRYHEINHFCE